MILDEVAKSTSTTWMKESRTAFYTDDGHLGSSLETNAGFERGLQNIGLVLDTLQFGMTVNLTKSAILLELKGQLKSKAKKKYMRSQFYQTLLRIDGALHHYEIPIRSTHDYLGVKISYSDTQKHTMRHRFPEPQHDAETCPVDQLSPSYLPISRKVAL